MSSTLTTINAISRQSSEESVHPATSTEEHIDNDDDDRVHKAAKGKKGVRFACPCQQQYHPHRRCVKHVLVTFGRSFYIAYGLRAALSLTLHIIRVLRKNPRELTSLNKLIGAQGLPIEAVRIGLFFGGFAGLYHGSQCLLARLRGIHDQYTILASGFVAGLSVLALEDKSSRRTMGLYMAARVLQSYYNSQKAQGKLPAVITQLQPHGDTLMFTLSCAQIMYAYVMRPDTLPPSYLAFMVRTAGINKVALTAAKLQNRGIPFEVEPVQQFINRATPKGQTPTDVFKLLAPYLTTILRRSDQQSVTAALPPMVGCEIIHPQCAGCLNMTLHTAKHAAASVLPVYMSLTFVPMVVLQFWSLMRNPGKMIGRGLFSALRSTSFLSAYVTTYLSLICLSRHILTRDHRSVYFLAGLVSPLSILLERKTRRAELALYVLPRAVDSLYISILQKSRVPRIPHGEVLLYCMSMAMLMWYKEYSPESMSPLLRRLLNFFCFTQVPSSQQQPKSTDDSTSKRQPAYERLESSDSDEGTVSKRGSLSQHAAYQSMRSSGSLHILPALAEGSHSPAAKHSPHPAIIPVNLSSVSLADEPLHRANASDPHFQYPARQ